MLFGMTLFVFVMSSDTCILFESVVLCVVAFSDNDWFSDVSAAVEAVVILDDTVCRPVVLSDARIFVELVKFPDITFCVSVVPSNVIIVVESVMFAGITFCD